MQTSTSAADAVQAPTSPKAESYVDLTKPPAPVARFQIPFHALQAAALIASRDETRYILNGVLFERVAEDEALLVATDAKRLLAIKIRELGAENIAADCQIIIPIRLIEVFLGLEKLKSYQIPVLVEVRPSAFPGGARRITLSMAGGMSVGAAEVVGNFPNWRNPDIIPKEPLVPSEATFHPRLMADFLEVAELFHKDPVGKAWKSKAPASARERRVGFPHVIDLHCPDVLAVIMPREDLNSSVPMVPAWALPAEAPAQVVGAREQVVRVLAEELQCEAEGLGDGARLIEDLGADSMDLAEVLMKLETACDIVLSNDEWSAWKTVGDVVATVEAAVAIKEGKAG